MKSQMPFVGRPILELASALRAAEGFLGAVDLQVAPEDRFLNKTFVTDRTDMLSYSQVAVHVRPKFCNAHNGPVADVALYYGGALVDFGLRRGVGVVFADRVLISIRQFVWSNWLSRCRFSIFLTEGFVDAGFHRI